MAQEKTPKKSTLSVSADEFISQELSGVRGLGWMPPKHFVPHLDKFILHNRKHPECRFSAVKITAWLDRNGVKVGKDCVYRWLKKRGKELK